MTKKAVSKRIKITKGGKFIRRKMGIGHSKAKKTGKQTRHKRLTVAIHSFDVKMFKKYLGA